MLQYGTIFFQIFLTASSLFALYAVRSTYLEMRDEIANLYAALYAKNTVVWSMGDESQAGYEFLTCGGCGKSVPSDDGFAPVEHGCDALAA